MHKVFKVSHFNYSMTRRDRIFGWIYLPIHILVLPLLMNIYVAVAMDPPSEIALNVVYYGIGIAFVLIFMRGYLRRDFDQMLDNKVNSLLTLVTSYFMNVILSYIGLALLALLVSEVENPNNEAVFDMAGGSYNAIFGMSVFMAPIVEEVLFRGLVFGSIRRKSRLWAYIVSAGLFSLYHVWQFALGYMDPTVLLYAIQYIPVSIALAWCYEKSGSIWVPTFFHMLINFISMNYIRM